MQFQVPQFIETEDKIIGPFSLRQFAYIGVGGFLSAMLYFVAASWLWIIGSLFIFAAAFAFAFVKVEGRPFLNVVISAFHYYWKPQIYVWQPEHPTVKLPPKKDIEEDGSALEDILASSASKSKRVFTGATAPAIKPHIVEKPADEPAAVAKPFFAQPLTKIFSKPIERLIEKTAPAAVAAEKPISRESVATGSALHKTWEETQTGGAFAKKNSDKQFIERKMAERYQIFRRTSGDRDAAKRVDYR